MATAASTKQQRMFLSYEHWSPRYDDTFFTIKMESAELFDSKPPPKRLSTSLSRNSLSEEEASESVVGVSNDEDIGQGNTNFPAYYYKIEIFCSRQPSYVIYRRYSQFHWLYKQLQTVQSSSSSTTSGDHDNNQQQQEQQQEQKLVEFPPGTCFWYKQNDLFAQNRLVQLYEFMKDTLQIPKYANHPSVKQFLELEQQ